MVEKMATHTNLRPMCGFCKNEVKELPAMTSDGITLHCCASCGAVLGVTRYKAI